jgi:chaperonin GroES
MKIKPIRDRIVVQPIQNETQTQSGIFIPDTATEKPQQGNVLAVGSGRVAENGTIVPLTIKASDQVLYAKHAGQTVKLDGEEFLILREEEIIAVIEQGE